MSVDILNQVSMVAAVILPLFNIPLVIRIIQRKSAQDISLVWLFGVWICVLLMFPSGVRSADVVFRVFNVMNLILFTMVVVVTLRYKKVKS